MGLQFFGLDACHPGFLGIGVRSPFAKLSGTTLNLLHNVSIRAMDEVIVLFTPYNQGLKQGEGGWGGGGRKPP